MQEGYEIHEISLDSSSPDVVRSYMFSLSVCLTNRSKIHYKISRLMKFMMTSNFNIFSSKYKVIALIHVFVINVMTLLFIRFLF